MSEALNANKCPQCGGSLPAKQLEGLCPVCLLDAAGDSINAESGGRKRFEPPSLHQIGRLFPQLTILKLLGAGGMGAVYQARQPKLDRFVALKILPPGSGQGANFEERFNREARALARLNHPNIVGVHEFGQAEGLHYFIMEYVDGTNLRQLEQAGRLSPREALQVIPQICDALQYAHDEGVVHRDIKPENVLVDRKGRVKIADFGLAKILSRTGGEARLTAEGQVMGTPHYMAPEQVERPLSVDHRADIYSLGVVFYEMLTGDLPLGKFPPPSRKVMLDVRLDEVVLRALENDPSRRYQNASEVKSELETLSEAAPAINQPPAAPAGAPKPADTAKPRERYVHWAGIALAVDREGDREIRWDGGITVLGIGIILALIGLWLFKVLTGLPSPSLTGIPFLVMLLIVGSGFRWALNTPLPDPSEPKLTEKGTVILEEEPQFGWSVLAFGSIVPAMILWGLIVSYGFPLLRGQPLPEPKRVTFAATTELRFDSFIDFDTAKTAEPTSDSGENPLAGIAETVNWMEREGMDAAASSDGLQPLGMVFAAVENADWSTLTPEDVTNRLRDGMFRPSKLTPLNNELPSTFVFQTREGGTGVLQLCGLGRPGQPGISLRYKLIQHSAPTKP